jgi:hypothetical protein
LSGLVLTDDRVVAMAVDVPGGMITFVKRPVRLSASRVAGGPAEGGLVRPIDAELRSPWTTSASPPAAVRITTVVQSGVQIERSSGQLKVN